MAVNTFIFGAGTQDTPESLKRKREIAEALIKGRTGQPRNVGEAIGMGLTGFGDALLYRKLMGDVDKGEKEGKAAGESDFAPLVNADLFSGMAMPKTTENGDTKVTTTGGGPEFTSNEIYSGFIDTAKAGGLTNPFGLAAVAATGRAESGFSPKNANRTWSDPSESGQAGTAGGILSWRGPRLQALQNFAAQKGERLGAITPQTQAEFFLQENPQLISALNNAKSAEEAANLMADAWRFAGYNRPGGEAARRLGYAQEFLPRFQGGTEVASLDPSAGMPAMAEEEPAAPAFDAGRFGDAPVAPQQGRQALIAALTASNGRTPYRDPMVSAPNYNPSAPNPVVAALAAPQAAEGELQPLPSRVVAAPPPVAAVAPEPPPVPPSAPQGPSPVARALIGQQTAQANMPADYFPAAPSAPGQSGPSMSQIVRALTSPNTTPEQKAVARVLFEQRQQMSDPLRKLQIEKAQRELNAPNVPDSVQALDLRAQRAGLQPGTPEYTRFMLSGGDKGITINNEGSIPAGYQAQRDADGRITSIQPIPGSPAALEMEQALRTKETQGERRQTATDTITTAAQNARDILSKGGMTTGTLGRIASNLPESDAAELRRQIGVLTSNATIENLTAMRQSSPTGGALGSVTEKEGAMLAAAAGAIDPNAGREQVQQALDNYERTLLRVIHGPKVGDAIFEQTRRPNAPPEGVSPEDWEFMTPEERRLFQP